MYIDKPTLEWFLSSFYIDVGVGGAWSRKIVYYNLHSYQFSSILIKNWLGNI